MPAAEPAPAARARPTRPQRAALISLVVMLGLIPVALAASAASPGGVAATLGHRSTVLAVVAGISALLGLALLPVLDRMGRIGAVVLAVPVVTFAVTDAVSSATTIPASTGSFEVDALLQLLLPVGWFLLLFGALRRAGWARRGSLLVLVAALVLSAAVFLIPSGDLPVEDMADRIVYHGLLNVGVVVAAIAALMEGLRRRGAVA